MKKLIVDIETTAFPVTKIWMIGTKDCQTGTKKNFLVDQFDKFQDFINGYDVVIGHNIIDFDIPILERFLKTSFKQHKIVDTLVLSRLYNPQLEDGHSLRAWGDRLKFLKGDYDDWTQLTPEMIKYCEQDCDVTHKVYDVLTEKLEEFGEVSIDLEHQVQKVITRQIQNGWLLDQKKCYDLLAELKQRKMEVEDEVHKKFKALPVFIKEITPKYNKDGRLSNVGLRFYGDNRPCICGSFSRVDWPEFNLGSRKQIGRHLQFFGWVPKTYTEKGSVIVDEAVLSKVKNIPEASLIAEYLLIQKRMAQVDSWLTEEQKTNDGRVHGRVNPIGAVTGRMTHSSPNMAQVPASYSPYGEECRSCWIVPKGYKLVGIDASGLELRMLAHYMNDNDYIEEVTNGDVHTANMKAAGLTDRDQAKTFIYAFLYGAGDAKIGSIVGGSKTDGYKLKNKFLENTPTLRKLRERVSSSCGRGHLKGLDGRKLIIRSEHAAVNTLLQSAGAIIMKKALTTLDEYAILHSIEYKFVGNIHDEFQVEVKEQHASKFGWLAVECIKAAGLEFNLRCPLDGEYKVGNTWAETH